MNKENRLNIGRLIRIEMARGIHTYSMCSCKRRGCRGIRCWECLLEDLELNK